MKDDWRLTLEKSGTLWSDMANLRMTALTPAIFASERCRRAMAAWRRHLAMTRAHHLPSPKQQESVTDRSPSRSTPSIADLPTRRRSPPETARTTGQLGVLHSVSPR